MIVYCLCGHQGVFRWLISLLSHLSFRFGRLPRILFAAIRGDMHMALVFGTLTTILFLIQQSWMSFLSLHSDTLLDLKLIDQSLTEWRHQQTDACLY